jgi:hypothetical protein
MLDRLSHALLGEDADRRLIARPPTAGAGRPIQ